MPDRPHVAPADEAARIRFAKEIGRNFSLECPAGSGKTHAAVQRVVALAQSPNGANSLRRLVLSTFTNKSAEEMRVRARDAILAANVSRDVQIAFNHATFCTIHAFALKLLENHGHHLGVPGGGLDADPDIEELWSDFLSEWDGHTSLWSNERAQRVLRLVPLQELFRLAQKWDFARDLPVADPMPDVDFSAIYGFVPAKRVLASVTQYQDDLRAWQKTWKAGDAYCPFPQPEKGGKEFLAIAEATTAAMNRWASTEAGWVASEIARAFRDFRVRNGALTFGDQISLAAALVVHPEAIKEIRERGFIVILDEAQDTDPEQFNILLEVSRPIGATGTWRSGGSAPEGGRFSMVGDGGQSIYRHRADLATYRAAHAYIANSPQGEGLGFDVTFRCDTAIVDVANRWLPKALDGCNGQVPFVPLVAKPTALAGQVLRLPAAPRDNSSLAEDDEAEQIARWIQEAGLELLRARRWGDVALLCPRKRWFTSLRRALHAAGLRTQLLSTRSTMADSPAFAWMTALAVVMAEPANAFELFGVLREVFGLSDSDIAFFVKSDSTRLQIAQPTSGVGIVASTLTTLHELRQRLLDASVGAAAAIIDREVVRPRLEALFPDDPSVRTHAMKAVACAASLQNGNLSAWAAALTADLNQPVEEASVDPDAIAIVTNLKAKGLEWDAVVVPFLCREVTDRAEEYPRFEGRRCDPLKVALGRGDVSDSDLANDDQDGHHELARIAYVTITRARHTLVLVDDQAFLGEKPIPANSIAAALRLDDANRAEFLALRTSGEADGSAPAASAEPAPAAQAAVPIDLGPVQAAAEAFPAQVLPHRLARSFTKDEPEVRASILSLEVDTQASPRDYGIWWHELMRAMPWTEGTSGWDSHFAAGLESCPDRDRAQRDWPAFQASSVAARLALPGTLVLTEVPFEAALKDGSILNGVMDLIALSPAQDRWLLVDWKASEHEYSQEAMVARYRRQLEAYEAALTGITGLPADVVLYGTTSGVVGLARAA
jgi:ATP-dependent exoDNAse (exonuclease V) beta subunit